jgi:hypothetical protein
MESTSNKLAINNGLFIGGISAVLNILIYYIYPQMMGNTIYGIFMMFIAMGLYVFFTIDLRKKIGGFWSFKEALKGIFLMSFIAGLLSTFVNFVFYKFIEPGAFEQISGIITENLTVTYEKLGMDQVTIENTIEKVLESMKSQFNPSFVDLLKTLGIGVLIQFIMSLIFAAIFKKEQPIFTSTEE